MIQFPLRPSYRPMPYAPKTARVKPDNQILQLDYEVDQKSEHFDKDAEDYLKQKTLRLQSTTVPHLSNYVVGVFRQGQLHLTPVSSILQMRPSLAYIDEAVEGELEGMLIILPSIESSIHFDFLRRGDRD
jgi:DNA-directed RNA polymerase-3 subunit RPC5